ncbi:hypothetical protein NMQ01_09360 [Janibacter sp. CX7]|jgi:hypothetical protein|uniref:hypothetical protein n=1 Tax=Janibacter sp. CX7 TaxID=2963431 RepID=UPI0020CEC283|nr:hypothetical protein [Janibacter sp. CX7]UTT64941.1 hypothetical protein NMQ01_09360 [Janibacter sp. CX7]
MTSRTTTALLAATPLALGLALAAAPQASAATTPPADAELLVQVADVYSGHLEGIAGNRHRVRVAQVDGRTTGFVQSWTCPSEATVTTRWVSPSCTHRSTFSLREQWGAPPQARVSSTGRSGVIAGKLVGVNRTTGWQRSFTVDLTMRAGTGATADRDPAPSDGESTTVWSTATFSGDVSGADVWVKGTPQGTSSLFGWTD